MIASAKKAKREKAPTPARLNAKPGAKGVRPPPGNSNLVIEEPLSKDERHQLATLKKTIERTIRSTFEFGAALREIRDRRLYRETHSSFETFMADEFGISKGDAHRQIQCATKFETVQPIAEKLGITIANPSQMRPLFKVEDRDLPDVLKRAKRDAGNQRLTADVLAKAAKIELTSPDELKRQAERRRDTKRPSYETISADSETLLEPSAQAPVIDRSTAETAVGDGYSGLEETVRESAMIVAFDKGMRRNTLADIAGPDEWLVILRGHEPIDGSDPGFWSGQPNRHARQLRAVAAIVRRMANWQQPGPPGVEGTGSSPRQDLARLLHSLAEEISGESTLLHGLTNPSAKARAK